jgi:hypothetical protein
MAVLYLILMIYFRSIGGYRPLTVGGEESASPATNRKETTPV